MPVSLPSPAAATPAVPPATPPAALVARVSIDPDVELPVARARRPRGAPVLGVALEPWPARPGRYYALPSKLALLAQALCAEAGIDSPVPPGPPRTTRAVLERGCPRLADLYAVIARYWGWDLQWLAGPPRTAGSGSGPAAAPAALLAPFADLARDPVALLGLLASPESYLAFEDSTHPQPRAVPSDRGPLDRLARHLVRPPPGDPGVLRQATLTLDAGHRVRAARIGLAQFATGSASHGCLAPGVVVLAAWEGLEGEESWRGVEDPSFVVMDALAAFDPAVRFVDALPVVLGSEPRRTGAAPSVLRLLLQEAPA